MLRQLAASATAFATLFLASCDEHKTTSPGYAALRRAVEQSSAAPSSPQDTYKLIESDTAVWESCWLGNQQLRVAEPTALEQPGSDASSRPYMARAGQVVTTISSGHTAPKTKCDVAYSVGRGRVTGFLPLSVLAPVKN
jgi:hypothetical protein